jgi:general secretion pathway protein L
VKIVGLHIDKGRVAASIVERGMRQTELKDSFSQAFATDAELADILRDKAKDWVGGRIVSSIPGRWFSQRTVHFPFSDRKRVEKALPFELEDSVPFPLEDVELDHLVLERSAAGPEKTKETPVLGLMLPKTVLRRHLDLLASAGVDPQVIVPSPVGLYHLAKMVPVEGVALLIHDSDLCMKNGNSVIAGRSFSGAQATAGIRHTIKSLETEHAVTIEKVYLLSENEQVRMELVDLGLAVEQLSPDFHGKKAADPLSLGLALSEQVNFRKGAFAYRLADVGQRNRRRTLIAAGALAAALAITNLGVKLYLVQTSYGRLDREIREVFRQAVPDAKVVADPVRQLRTRLDEAKKKFGVLGSGSSALDVMKAVTEGIPKEIRVSFQEFLLETDRLKLSGEAASFESVDKMKAELQKSPLFAEVVVQDTRMGVDNKVKFRFELKLKQAL